MLSGAIVALTARQRPVDFRRHHRDHEGNHLPQPRPVALASPSIAVASQCRSAELASRHDLTARPPRRAVVRYR